MLKEIEMYAPNFSVYLDEADEALNPLNIRHCLRLLYWIYFSPTHLKCYLYQLDPDFYIAEPSLKIFSSLLSPPHQTLYLTALTSSLFLSTVLYIVGVPLLLLIPAFNHVHIQSWLGVVSGLVGILMGTAVGSLFFLLFFSVFGVALSIARGIISGLIVGVATGVAISTLLSVGLMGAATLEINTHIITYSSGVLLIAIALFLSISKQWSLKALTVALFLSLVMGLVSGLIFDIAVNALINPTTGDVTLALSLSFALVVGGLVSIAIGGITGSIVGGFIGGTCTIFVATIFGIVNGLLSVSQANIELKITVILIGFAGGMAAIGVSGAALSFIQGILHGALMGVALGIAFGIRFDVEAGVLTGVVCSSLALRIPFNAVEGLLALRSVLMGTSHPCTWDEVFTSPLPGSVAQLRKSLDTDESKGWLVLLNLLCNPFQRWVAQKGYKAYLIKHRDPLGRLYDFLKNSMGHSYIFAPVTAQGWEQLPTVNQVLLGELKGAWVDCSLESTSRTFERIVYQLTLWQRDRRSTPITDFAGLLYDLSTAQVSQQKQPRAYFLNQHALYERLLPYPGGEEIQQSFLLMETFLNCQTFADIVKSTQIEVRFPEPAIRPQLIQVLYRLIDIGEDIERSLRSVTQINKQNALLRANNALDLMNQDVTHNILLPEQGLLLQIVNHWRSLVSEAGGELANLFAQAPISNPYTAGNPVESDRFIGREDIMQRLEELWNTPGHPPSVILYGHRRMGKTSILRNLQVHLGDRMTVIHFNLQLVGNVQNTSELLYALAIQLYDCLLPSQQETLQEPDINDFSNHNPYQRFLRFLGKVDRLRHGQRFVIAMDEFELLEQLIDEGVLESSLIRFWRGLIQTYPWLIMIFAGLHTLSEMQQDYWSPFFSSITAIPVSFLGPNAAKRLITQPTPDFELEYDLDVVQNIIQLTYGQPYLIQLLGRALVTQYNRQVFEEEQQRDQSITLEDLGCILASPEFYSEGNAYFSGVWRQAAIGPPPNQLEILDQLAHGPLSLKQLQINLESDFDSIRNALQTLGMHDVIMAKQGNYSYTVELMRRWVLHRAP